MQCLPIFFLEFAITHAMTSDCSTLLNYATNEKSFVVLDNIRSIFLRTLIHLKIALNIQSSPPYYCTSFRRRKLACR